MIVLREGETMRELAATSLLEALVEVADVDALEGAQIVEGETVLAKRVRSRFGGGRVHDMWCVVEVSGGSPDESGERVTA